MATLTTTEGDTRQWVGVRRLGSWFADPFGSADLRWWDGGEWSSHVRDNPGVAPDATLTYPLPAPPLASAPPPRTSTAPPARPRWVPPASTARPVQSPSLSSACTAPPVQSPWLPQASVVAPVESSAPAVASTAPAREASGEDVDSALAAWMSGVSRFAGRLHRHAEPGPFEVDDAGDGVTAVQRLVMPFVDRSLAAGVDGGSSWHNAARGARRLRSSA